MVQLIKKLLTVLMTAAAIVMAAAAVSDVTAQGLAIEGRIVYPKYTLTESLSTSLTLTDLKTKKQTYSYLKEDGTFEIPIRGDSQHNGSFLLEVSCTEYMIDHPLVQIKVEHDIEDGQTVIRAYKLRLGTSMDENTVDSATAIEIGYPLLMGALQKYNYYESKNKGFLAGTGQLGMILNNKWLVGGIAVMLVLLAFSYIVDQVDPDTMERIKNEKQNGGVESTEPLIAGDEKAKSEPQPVTQQPVKKTVKKKK